ncbi:MAG TPA: glycoside hydrolase family 2 TIM barrel-domain containing protein [Vicinamibacterales bacterium]|nr:glycoside hydrolase family 2 TIM barrel-domain containing protein [Vicinamibacterales bacterium]
MDGEWDFALDPHARWQDPREVVWDRRIRVPFAPETPASGVGETGLFAACWYRRRLERPAGGASRRVLLHFAAVDWRATVWVDGLRVATHEGGYTPFHVDLTDHRVSGGSVELVVRAEDDPIDLAKPRGKQDWQPRPHSIWYPRTTGIWQTVWLETVPTTWIDNIRWTPNLERWEIALEATIGGAARDDLSLEVRLTAGDRVLAHDRYSVLAGEVVRRLALSDPGIDDSRNELLWSPHSPTLIHAELQLLEGRDQLVDKVRSYTALRAVAIEGDRLLLNGRPYFLRMVLDQGYWPASGMTAPDDGALRRDVELARAMGFNGVRKHQKVESPRYLYWADVLGLLVWEEMPSAYRFTRLSVGRLVREWSAVLERDYSHPCIIAWVPINESWGVPNLPASPSERHYVSALYHLTRTVDPTRPVVGNDGWESVATDIIGVHDYDPDPARLGLRYQGNEPRGRFFRRERPGGRALVLDGNKSQPIVLTEFGGIALAADAAGTWGYCRALDAGELESRYARLLGVVANLPRLAGFCYTQFADTYQEANGLLFADRTPKFPLPRMAAATVGLPLP